MDTYDDVAVSQHGSLIFYCEKFSIDEPTRRIEFRNVTRKQNLWVFPIRDNILVSVWVADEKGKPKEGRLHIHGVVPGETDPAKQEPNFWYGSFNDVERYGSAA